MADTTNKIYPQDLPEGWVHPSQREIPNEMASVSEIREKLEQLRNEKSGAAYWQSLEELSETKAFDEFMHKEFPRQAAPLEFTLDRRNFVKLLGASMALAGLTSCVRPNPQEKILPYVRAPEAFIPGKPQFFASAIVQDGYAMPALIETHEGRPTKVEGNKEHAFSQGASDAQMQASILGMYDPDRSSSVRHSGGVRDWDGFISEVQQHLSVAPAGSVRLLTGAVTSLSLAGQIKAFLEANAGAVWHRYSPSNQDNAREGARLAFGRAVDSHYHFDEAEVIFSLDADFLEHGPAKLAYAKAFAGKRRLQGDSLEMNRLYALESTPTPTGTLADSRYPLEAHKHEAVLRAVARALGVAVADASTLRDAERNAGLPEGWLEVLVSDLQEAGAHGLVVAGASQPASVHALAHAVNHALGAVNTSLSYSESVELDPVANVASLQQLVQDINDGSAKTLIILGENPVYDAPADSGLVDALKKLSFTVHMGLYYDETAQMCMWHAPMTSDFEAWGDARSADGASIIVQPTLAPFYNGRSASEFFSALAGDNASSYDIVRDFWRNQLEGGDFELWWRRTLYLGYVENSALPRLEPALRSDFLQDAASSHSAEGVEVLFRPHPSVGDGRHANSGWLQELPTPFTKLTWDNAALISPRLAEDYHLRNGDMISLSHDGTTLQVPVWILPGQAHHSVTLQLGYGRTAAGIVGNGLGFDVYPLRRSDAMDTLTGVAMDKARGNYKLVSTQVHHVLDGRHIARHGTLAEVQANPEHPHFAHPIAHHVSDLYPDFEYETYAWGMVVDMSLCTGCNACITACQAENNIPVVGKEQVSMGREMHWLRVDSYYTGDLDNPDVIMQPMMCLHCEKAPCEPVCPVGATVHDSEGLNVMVYNRCVGTRYCSNNCPYKVRRYNFLQYAELKENALTMLANPDVTVRSRGVMEKCTYCTQRIQGAYINAENQGRRIFDGEVETACQAACAMDAITFGDTNSYTIDKAHYERTGEFAGASQVANLKAAPLNYTVLDELNTVPRTSYHAKVSNPNPALSSSTHHADASHAAGTQNEGGH